MVLIGPRHGGKALALQWGSVVGVGVEIMVLNHNNNNDTTTTTTNDTDNTTNNTTTTNNTKP